MYNQASVWTTDLQKLEGITQTPWWPFDSGATYFIAGLAYGVHVNDIRPDLADTQTISTYWMDVAEGQHLEHLNPYYLAAKYGYQASRVHHSMQRCEDIVATFARLHAAQKGLGTYLDVLTAEDALITNRRAVADLETRAFTLDVALIRALGGGYRA